MRVELLIEPGRPALMNSDAQEIRSYIAGMTSISFLVFAVAGDAIEWPTHLTLDYLPSGVAEARTLAGSGNPVTPEEGIDIVQQVPD